MSSSLSTSVVGLDQAGRAVSYVPPRATNVPRGSTVTYGPWLAVPPGGLGPGVYEIQAGSGDLQAANSGFIRTVTMTPL